MCIHFVIFLIL